MKLFLIFFINLFLLTSVSVGSAEDNSAINRETEGIEFIEENTIAFLSGLGEAFVDEFEKQHISPLAITDVGKEVFKEYLRKTIDEFVERISKKLHNREEPLPTNLQEYLDLLRETFFEEIGTTYRDLAAYQKRLEKLESENKLL